MSMIDPKAAIAAGQETIRTEARALEQLAEALAGALKDPFVEAARLLADTKGRVIVSGMGKSGHIARKIAATLASTGTPAQFVRYLDSPRRVVLEVEPIQRIGYDGAKMIRATKSWQRAEA